MLDTLTGQPVVEDELLFCIPVSAPYSVLINYRWVPGTRGTVVRAAISFNIPLPALPLILQTLVFIYTAE